MLDIIGKPLVTIPADYNCQKFAYVKKQQNVLTGFAFWGLGKPKWSKSISLFSD